MEPVTLQEAKSHLRIDLSFADDDAYVDALIKVAREYCEKYQNRAYTTQTFGLYLDAFPISIKLSRPPLQSVTSIKYYGIDGAENILDPSNYIVDVASEPGRIIPAYGKTWPTIPLQPINGVVVRYVSGYGSDAAEVPQGVKQSVLMLVGYWYENREAATLERGVSQRLEFAIDALLGMDRVVSV